MKTNCGGSADSITEIINSNVVHTFDDNKIKKLIKESHPELKEYVQALKNIIEISNQTIILTKKKIKELQTEIDKLKKEK